MKTTNAFGEKTLREIKLIMQSDPTPCQIIPKLPLNPGVEEIGEFASVEEIWGERLENFED